MNPQVKIDFLAALRSGQYTQTSGVMCEVWGDKECHCASGVLTEVAMKSGVEVNKVLIEHPVLRNFYYYDGNASRLPEHVAQWAGLDYYERSRIIALNDGGHTFEEIADWVEVNL